MLLATSSSFDQVRERLLPKVGPVSTMLTTDLIPGHLSISLVIDGVDGARTVDSRDLRGWHVSFEDAFSVAMDNLRKRTLARDFLAVRSAPGLYAWLGTDGLAAARTLLVRELLRPWPLAGALIAMPSPDQLLVLGLSDLEAMEALPTLVQTRSIAAALGARAVSEELFWHDGASLHALSVKHTDEGMVIDPPAAFVRALKRLAALELSGPAAEA